VLKGTVPDIDQLLPPRPQPVKRTAPEDTVPQAFGGGALPNAMGAGFFTPAPGMGFVAPNAGAAFVTPVAGASFVTPVQGNGAALRGWKPDAGPSQPFRMHPPG
jgi:hypothetical protein